MNIIDSQNQWMPNFNEYSEKQKQETLCQFVRSLTSLVTDAPKALAVSYQAGDRTTIFTVDCDPQFMGQLLGKEGKNINAIRTLVGSVAARMGVRTVIEVTHVPKSR